MARLPYVDPANAPPAVRRALEGMPPLNIFRTLAHAETAFRPAMRFGGALLTEGELDNRLRELAILRVAAQDEAEYEWIQHAAIARSVGATDEEVAAIERGDIEADCFDETDQLVLGFASEVIEGGASEATFAAASKRFSAREVMELLLTIGYYMMLARVMRSVDIDLDAPVGSAVVDSARRRRRGEGEY
jgi:4-carboxymuconolactone decarboxylase